jgi:hypothetical protein
MPLPKDDPASEAVKELARQIETLAWTPMSEMTLQDKEDFALKHPGAFAVIGDFAIHCLKPEKYGL